MNIWVYVGPTTAQVYATRNHLEKSGLPYSIVNLNKDNRALDYVLSLGYGQGPVIVVEEPTPPHQQRAEPNRHWSGFRPDLIKALADEFRQPESEAS